MGRCTFEVSPRKTLNLQFEIKAEMLEVEPSPPFSPFSECDCFLTRRVDVEWHVKNGWPFSALKEYVERGSGRERTRGAHVQWKAGKLRPCDGDGEGHCRCADIRRAQLEREPTPPPPSAEDLALRRQQQRKRPKKARPPPAAAPTEGGAAGAGPDGTTRTTPSGGGGGGGSARAKRPRKGSRADEDYELYLEALMGRLRALPPVRILEPQIRPNFNVGAVFGRGDLNLRGKGVSLRVRRVSVASCGGTP